EGVGTGRGRAVARGRVRRSWQATAGLPIFLYGAIVNAPAYWIPRWLAHVLASRETDYATTRLLASVVAVPLFWGLETFLVWRLAGTIWAAVFAASLPLTGVLAYRYLGTGRRPRIPNSVGLPTVTPHHAPSRRIVARRRI